MTNSRLINWLLKFETHRHHLADYMHRYWIFLPKSKTRIQIRLHNILRSDTDRHPHNHPWWYITLILRGGYREQTYIPSKDGVYEHGIIKGKWYGPGSILFRKATHLHRLELPANATKETWTLFICGKKSNEWGFMTEVGIIPWRQYLEETGQFELLRQEEPENYG